MEDSYINFYQEDIDFNLENELKVIEWINVVAELYSKQVGELNFFLCSDNYLLDINRNELNHDYYTDVITFDNCIDDLIFGDIYISVDRVAENEKKYSDGKYPEILRIIIHGVLHLIGFKDKELDEKNIMTDKENLALELYSKM